MNNSKYLVQVRCITYNQAPYITDAMNGFCLQKTNFPFVCTIIDDASTDGEQNVIKKYLEDCFDLTDKTVVRNEETNDYLLTFARHKTNKNCYFAVLFLKYNHYSIKKSKSHYLKEWRESSKYIGLCEGDDYWIDPNKLQNQVDFLNEHEEYGLIYTDYNRLEQTGDKDVLYKSIFQSGKTPIILSFQDHLKLRGYIAPMSWVYRSEYWDISKEYKGENANDWTFIFALELMLHTKVFYLNKVTSVYRVHWGSATHQKSVVNKMRYDVGLYSIQTYYLNKCNLHREMPECRDWFFWPNHRYIIAANDKSKLPELKSFFKRRKSVSIRARVLYTLMSFKIGFWGLKTIYGLKNKQLKKNMSV